MPVVDDLRNCISESPLETNQLFFVLAHEHSVVVSFWSLKRLC